MLFARDDPHPSCSSRARSAVTEISLVGAIKMLRHSHCKDISTMQLSWLKSEPLVFFVTSMASLRNAARKTSQGNTNRISVFALNRNPNQHMQTNMYPLDKPVTISPNFWFAWQFQASNPLVNVRSASLRSRDAILKSAKQKKGISRKHVWEPLKE